MARAVPVSAFAPPVMPTDASEMLAIRVLGFIGRDDYRTSRFLKQSGLGPDTIREAARSRSFLLGVLDYLAADEGLLTAFCIEENTHPQAIQSARNALAPVPMGRPDGPPTASIVVQCEHCSKTSIRRRSELPHAPRSAVRLLMPRCGKCGGGFDQIETWLDRRGNEVE